MGSLEGPAEPHALPMRLVEQAFLVTLLLLAGAPTQVAGRDYGNWRPTTSFAPTPSPVTPTTLDTNRVVVVDSLESLRASVADLASNGSTIVFRGSQTHMLVDSPLTVAPGIRIGLIGDPEITRSFMDTGHVPHVTLDGQNSTTLLVVPSTSEVVLLANWHFTNGARCLTNSGRIKLIRNCAFTKCIAPHSLAEGGWGGAIRNNPGAHIDVLTGSLFRANLAGSGGSAISSEEAVVRDISHCAFEGNSGLLGPTITGTIHLRATQEPDGNLPVFLQRLAHCEFSGNNIQYGRVIFTHNVRVDRVHGNYVFDHDVPVASNWSAGAYMHFGISSYDWTSSGWDLELISRVLVEAPPFGEPRLTHNYFRNLRAVGEDKYEIWCMFGCVIAWNRWENLVEGWAKHSVFGPHSGTYTMLLWGPGNNQHNSCFDCSSPPRAVDSCFPSTGSGAGYRFGYPCPSPYPSISRCANFFYLYDGFAQPDSCGLRSLWMAFPYRFGESSADTAELPKDPEHFWMSANGLKYCLETGPRKCNPGMGLIPAEFAPVGTLLPRDDAGCVNVTDALSREQALGEQRIQAIVDEWLIATSRCNRMLLDSNVLQYLERYGVVRSIPVRNATDPADGRNGWFDPITGAPNSAHLFDALLFHIRSSLRNATGTMGHDANHVAENVAFVAEQGINSRHVATDENSLDLAELILAARAWDPARVQDPTGFFEAGDVYFIRAVADAKTFIADANEPYTMCSTAMLCDDCGVFGPNCDISMGSTLEKRLERYGSLALCAVAPAPHFGNEGAELIPLYSFISRAIYCARLEHRRESGTSGNATHSSMVRLGRRASDIAAAALSIMLSSSSLAEDPTYKLELEGLSTARSHGVALMHAAALQAFGTELVPPLSYRFLSGALASGIPRIVELADTLDSTDKQQAIIDEIDSSSQHLSAQINTSFSMLTHGLRDDARSMVLVFQNEYSSVVRAIDESITRMNESFVHLSALKPGMMDTLDALQSSAMLLVNATAALERAELAEQTGLLIFRTFMACVNFIISVGYAWATGGESIAAAALNPGAGPGPGSRILQEAVAVVMSRIAAQKTTPRALQTGDEVVIELTELQPQVSTLTSEGSARTISSAGTSARSLSGRDLDLLTVAGNRETGSSRNRVDSEGTIRSSYSDDTVFSSESAPVSPPVDPVSTPESAPESAPVSAPSDNSQARSNHIKKGVAAFAAAVPFIEPIVDIVNEFGEIHRKEESIATELAGRHKQIHDGGSRLLESAKQLAALLQAVVNDFLWMVTAGVSGFAPESGRVEILSSNPARWDDYGETFKYVLRVDFGLCPDYRQGSGRRLQRGPESKHSSLESRRGARGASSKHFARTLESKYGVPERQAEVDLYQSWVDANCTKLVYFVDEVVLWGKNLHDSFIATAELYRRGAQLEYKVKRAQSRAVGWDDASTAISAAAGRQQADSSSVSRAVRAFHRSVLEDQTMDLVDAASHSLFDCCRALIWSDFSLATDDLQRKCAEAIPLQDITPHTMRTRAFELGALLNEMERSFLSDSYARQITGQRIVLDVTAVSNLEDAKLRDFRDLAFSLKMEDGWLCLLDNVEVVHFGIFFEDASGRVLGSDLEDVITSTTLTGPQVKRIGNRYVVFNAPAYRDLVTSYTIPSVSGACAQDVLPFYGDRVCQGAYSYTGASNEAVFALPSPFTTWSSHVIQGTEHLLGASRVKLWLSVHGSVVNTRDCANVVLPGQEPEPASPSECLRWRDCGSGACEAGSCRTGCSTYLDCDDHQACAHGVCVNVDLVIRKIDPESTSASALLFPSCTSAILLLVIVALA